MPSFFFLTPSPQPSKLKALSCLRDPTQNQALSCTPLYTYEGKQATTLVLYNNTRFVLTFLALYQCQIIVLSTAHVLLWNYLIPFLFVLFPFFPIEDKYSILFTFSCHWLVLLVPSSRSPLVFHSLPDSFSGCFSFCVENNFVAELAHQWRGVICSHIFLSRISIVSFRLVVQCNLSFFFSLFCYAMIISIGVLWFCRQSLIS